MADLLARRFAMLAAAFSRAATHLDQPQLAHRFEPSHGVNSRSPGLVGRA
jgi:hypothetical protein